MSKKAYLVTFEVTARVSVETNGKTTEQIREDAVEAAAKKVEAAVYEEGIGENFSTIEEDTVEPHGTLPYDEG